MQRAPAKDAEAPERANAEDGGSNKDRFDKAMKSAVLDSQRKDGASKGSWDPKGPWGFAGGRVYSTALGVLCLEVYFRYAKVLGGR